MLCATAEFAIPVGLQFQDGLRERVTAEIARVNSGFLLLRSSAAIDSSRKMHVCYLDRQIPGETVYCHAQSDGSYRAGVRLLEGTNGALRVERRIRIDTPGVLNAPVLSNPISVRVIDMSSSGMGVKLAAFIKPGDPAYVELELGVAFGEIRHCEKIDGGYRAGLFIEEFIARTPSGFNAWAAQSAQARSEGAPAKMTSALRTALFSKRK